MFELFKKCKNILDYLPLVLVTVLFVAESELEKHALVTSCQIAITVVTLSIFYILIIRYKNSKFFAVFVSIVLWFILVCIKKKYIPN